jgi:hypothetical protein
MKKTLLEHHKEDFAAYQLLETDKEDLPIQKELSEFMD